MSDRDIEKLKLDIEIWKTIVDTQKHFNDLEMKIRNFGILIIAAFISGIGVSFKSGFTFTLSGMEIPVAALLSSAAAIIWVCFYFVDVIWYHPLLLGAVRKGIEIENDLVGDFPNVNLAATIREESRRDFLFFKKLDSTGKAHIFYRGILFVLIVCSILFFLAEKDPGNAANQQDSSALNEHL